MSQLTALYDACALYPAALRSFLMYLAVFNLFRARWTDRIHDEWISNLLTTRPDLTADQLTRTRRLMDASVPDCLVMGYDDVIDSLSHPDPDDRHVLAAAIRGKADVIVTTNLKDFPAETLAGYGIAAQHPDEFASHLFRLNPDVVCCAAQNHRASLKKPPRTPDEYLEALARTGLPRISAALTEIRDRL